MDTLKQSISFSLNYTTRNMRRYASERLARENAGVTVDQWGVLKILDENGGSLGNAELSAQMLKDRPTVTRIVDILCREGLVIRTKDRTDRRRMKLRLSERGREKIESVGPLVQRIRDDIGSGITPADRDDLMRVLDNLNQTINGLRDSIRD